jgi:two-component system response regulator DesR
MIRVVIAEDQSMVLGALAALLEIESDIQVVGRARNGREALDAVVESEPDVLLTDIEMPEMTGLELAAEVGRRKLATRIIILTTFARAGYLRRALEAGAAGYLLKDGPSEELANAVRRVHAGGRAVDPELAREAWTERDPPRRARAAGAPPGRRGAERGRHRREALPLRGHGAELPVRRHLQARRRQPRGGGEDRAGEGVVVTEPPGPLAPKRTNARRHPAPVSGWGSMRRRGRALTPLVPRVPLPQTAWEREPVGEHQARRRRRHYSDARFARGAPAAFASAPKRAGNYHRFTHDTTPRITRSECSIHPAKNTLL